MSEEITYKDILKNPKLLKVVSSKEILSEYLPKAVKDYETFKEFYNIAVKNTDWFIQALLLGSDISIYPLKTIMSGYVPKYVPSYPYGAQSLGYFLDGVIALFKNSNNIENREEVIKKLVSKIEVTAEECLSKDDFESFIMIVEHNIIQKYNKYITEMGKEGLIPTNVYENFTTSVEPSFLYGIPENLFNNSENSELVIPYNGKLELYLIAYSFAYSVVGSTKTLIADKDLLYKLYRDFNGNGICLLCYDTNGLIFKRTIKETEIIRNPNKYNEMTFINTLSDIHIPNNLLKREKFKQVGFLFSGINNKSKIVITGNFEMNYTIKTHIVSNAEFVSSTNLPFGGGKLILVCIKDKDNVVREFIIKKTILEDLKKKSMFNYFTFNDSNYILFEDGNSE